MNRKTDYILEIAAFFVLLSAMWEPLVSVAVAVAALLGIEIYKLAHKNN